MGVSIGGRPMAQRLSFRLSARTLQMLLGSKINSHISSNFCQDHKDGVKCARTEGEGFPQMRAQYIALFSSNV